MSSELQITKKDGELKHMKIGKIGGFTCSRVRLTFEIDRFGREG